MHEANFLLTLMSGQKKIIPLQIMFQTKDLFNILSFQSNQTATKAVKLCSVFILLYSPLTLTPFKNIIVRVDVNFFNFSSQDGDIKSRPVLPNCILSTRVCYVCARASVINRLGTISPIWNGCEEKMWVWADKLAPSTKGGSPSQAWCSRGPTITNYQKGFDSLEIHHHCVIVSVYNAFDIICRE